MKGLVWGSSDRDVVQRLKETIYVAAIICTLDRILCLALAMPLSLDYYNVVYFCACDHEVSIFFNILLN